MVHGVSGTALSPDDSTPGRRHGRPGDPVRHENPPTSRSGPERSHGAGLRGHLLPPGPAPRDVRPRTAPPQSGTAAPETRCIGSRAEGLNSLAFSDDDRRLFTAGGQGLVQAWNVTGANRQLTLGEDTSHPDEGYARSHSRTRRPHGGTGPVRPAVVRGHPDRGDHAGPARIGGRDPSSLGPPTPAGCSPSSAPSAVRTRSSRCGMPRPALSRSAPTGFAAPEGMSMPLSAQTRSMSSSMTEPRCTAVRQTLRAGVPADGRGLGRERSGSPSRRLGVRAPPSTTARSSGWTRVRAPSSTPLRRGCWPPRTCTA